MVLDVPPNRRILASACAEEPIRHDVTHSSYDNYNSISSLTIQLLFQTQWGQIVYSPQYSDDTHVYRWVPSLCLIIGLNVSLYLSRENLLSLYLERCKSIVSQFSLSYHQPCHHPTKDV